MSLIDFDILIGFTCSVTIYDKNFSYLNAKIIELNWLILKLLFQSINNLDVHMI